MWLKSSDARVEVADQDALARVMATERPALVLLDLGLPKLGGVQGLAAAFFLSPSSKILVFTKAPDERQAVRALKAGARGYSHLRINSSQFRDAVRAVRKGEIWVSRHVIPHLLNELSARGQSQPANPFPRLPDPLAKLTDRQREVALLVGEGASNKEIAQRLALTERTVKAHLTFIFRKLGVSDRLRLALLISGSARRSS